MATLTLTFAAGVPTGSLLRRMALQLEAMAGNIPDVTSTGASTTLVIDNAPGTGTATLQITGGPYPSALYPI